MGSNTRKRAPNPAEQVAAAFGDNGVASSICEDDYQPFVAALSERIASRLGSCE